jgi:hypothetical protein
MAYAQTSAPLDDLLARAEHFAGFAMRKFRRVGEGAVNSLWVLGSAAVVVAFLTVAPRVRADEMRLGTNVVVSFASVAQGRQVLTNRDEFVTALSPFDRAARMKTARQVTEPEFLTFLEQQVQPWSSDETNQMVLVLNKVAGSLVPWNLPLPPSLLLIKSSGFEEGHAFYTRQNAIIFPKRSIFTSRRSLEWAMTHELFHVLSRHNPRLRKKLCGIIGFSPINEVEYPDGLRQRKITNPDGVRTGWFIPVTHAGQVQPVIPVLYGSRAHYDPVQGGEFFHYLVFKLLVVAKDGDTWRPQLVNGQPQLLAPEEAGGFPEPVGNDPYSVIHPDEILAFHFVAMVNGETNGPTRNVLAAMRKVFLAEQH